VSRDASIAGQTAELTRLRAMTQDSGGVIGGLEQQIEMLSAEVVRLQGELNAREKHVTAMQDDLDTAGATLREREQEHALVQAALESLRGQHAKRGQEVTDLIAALNAQQKRSAALEADMATRARAVAALELQMREQDEVADAQAQELNNWKERWSEVAALVGEKDARLERAEVELRSKTPELAARAERIDALQKNAEDQAETIATLERELREKVEVLGRFEGDLRVAEDSMLRLESQLRQKNEQQSGVQRTLDEQRGQIRHLQDTLATRDATVARLEGELKANSELISNIQRDIRRLSSDVAAPRAVEPAQAPQLRIDSPPAEPEPMTRLFVRLEDDSEVVHVISKKTTSIGRTDDNDIPIDTRYISRHHARILSVPNATVIEDLGSTNGVYVNDRRVRRRQSLKDGDIVMVGMTRFRFAARLPERCR
jgi:chromosome segregation ATPase